MSNRVMGKLTRRSLRARWIRFALTTFAVVLGVAFVTGSFVLSDTLTKVFDSLASNAFANVDVSVRAVDALEGDDALSAARAPLSPVIVEQVRGVDGVARATGDASFLASVTTPDGGIIKTTGAPIFGFNWYDELDATDSAFKVVSGHGPRADGEMAVDKAAAKAYKLKLGDNLAVRGPGGSGTFTLTGLVDFADGGAGAYYTLYTTPVTQRLASLGDSFQTITVRAEDGVNEVELRDRIAEVLPEGFEAITGSEATQEFSDGFGTVISALRTALLVFAFVTFFVAAFLINTVFNTTVGQRVRELALLRALGARNSQVTRSVLAESLSIGFVGSLIGAVGGLGVAWLIMQLFRSQGGGFPNRALVLAPRTWVIALIVGVGITLLVSLVPAWRAGRVPPVAAMRDGFSLHGNRIRLRLVGGIGTGAVGLAIFLFSLFATIDSTTQRLSLMGAGALAVFLSVTALSPLFARPLVQLVSWPFTKIYGVTGRLAKGNASRDPRRTATTAAALMIGVALVSMVGVIGASFKSSFSEQLDQGIKADYFFTGESFSGFSPEFATKVAALPVVDTVTTFREGQVKVDGERKTIQGVQPTGLDKTVNLGPIEGDLSTIPDDGLLIEADIAKDRGLAIGDPVTMLFPVDGEATLRVTGIFDNPVSGANWLISQDTFAKRFPPELQLDAFGGATLKAGVAKADAEAELQALAKGYPEVKLQDRAQFKKDQEGQIDSAAVIVNGLLVFSLFIAVLGIAITLALAVFERTRELGLLRAVGQRRRQTRRMVRIEAITVALFGTTLGIALGLVFGLAISAAIPASVMSTIAVPWGQLIGTLIVAMLAGVFAALFPAWRASRLKVLDAIAYE